VLQKKKGDITIPVDAITIIFYQMPNPLSYLAMGLGSVGSNPKLFEINLCTEIDGKKMYNLYTRFKNIQRIEEFFPEIHKKITVFD
jgi:hypothetical protein